MPTVKILMWNTQHLNHQNERKPMSEAYEEKLDALLTTLATLKPEIVALFEVGTTGNPNLRLVEDLKGAYEMKVSLSLEGGLRKGTTLGSMVFVRNDIAADYVEPFELPLGEKAIRATLLLSDKSGNVFAFCHANASKAALEQVQDDIKLLGGFQGEGIKRLVFFGGDLNTHASDAPESITLPGHDKMYRCEPGNAGFTHISIRSSVALAKQLYQQEKKNSLGPMQLSESQYVNATMGTDVEAGDIAVPSLLDYAYIHESCQWKSICHASISVRTWSDKTKSFDSVGQINSNKVYATVQRVYLGKALRSDHFPVAYLVGFP